VTPGGETPQPQPQQPPRRKTRPSERVQEPRRRPPPREPMPTRHVAIVAAFVGVLYAGGMIARGDALPGIVGGVLAGILCILVLRRVGERQRQRGQGR
jgi:hypothetical protein